MLYNNRNIFVRVPLRISFCGGGTDFPVYYNKKEGHVVSATINSYVYINLKDMFDTNVRVHHEIIETQSITSRISNHYTRIALEHFGLFKGIEAVITSDIMRTGSGLGGSSSLMAGLILACAEYRNIHLKKREIAELCYQLETKSGTVCGKQDQYAAVYGGFNSLYFNNKGIKIEPLKLPRSKLEELEDCLLLVYTNLARESNEIQIEAFSELPPQKEKYLDSLYSLSLAFKEELLSKNMKLKRLGKLLDENWRLKRNLSPLSSNQYIDELYKHLKRNGLSGGKIAGAGGGGFIIGFAQNKKIRDKIAHNLYPNFICLKSRFVEKGAEILWKNF
ncbi:MAG: hypothetical protein ABIL70_02315 [candidate division WOR-3 bacterium]